jgi:LAO/AO transport system kinase
MPNPKRSSADNCDEWVRRCKAGDRRAVARLVTFLESPDRKTSREASRSASALPPPKQVIGITGPPGAGKSTLLDYLISLFRQEGRTVGVIAVDPSSPFTGGALLGDRIRMGTHRTDTGVFIRSMGNRGALGGLAAAASSALRVLGGAGFEVVLLETVGAGQSASEIINLADTVCVIQVPGLGDDIQLMKMGVLETADVFVVNKADRPDAKHLFVQIQDAVRDAPGETCRVMRQLGKAFASSFTGPRWTPEVVLVSALQQTGGPDLLNAFRKHRAYLDAPEISAALRSNRLAREIHHQTCRRLKEDLDIRLAPGGDLQDVVDTCARGERDLAWAVEEAIRRSTTA